MATNVVKILYADGREEEVNRKMNLEEMQKVVGGYIEFAPTKVKNRQLVCDEEGLLKDKPVNKAATELVHPNTLHYGIRGDVLLVKSR
jgi:hypothetical protein